MYEEKNIPTTFSENHLNIKFGRKLKVKHKTFYNFKDILMFRSFLHLFLMITVSNILFLTR